METLKNISKITAILLLCNSLSYANWKTVADSNVSIQTTSPTTLKTSLTNSFAGGSARVQWRNLGSTSVINATSPSFNIGCNGIEAGFGSISFLDFEELVNKLKMIASQAPAFAFKMAIDTACSQCSTIMQDLEGIVEAINSFSLDSCAIAQNIGEPIGQALGNVVNPSSSRYDDNYKALKSYNQDKSTFKMNDIKDTINSWSDTINGKSLKLEQLKGYGSFLNNLRINKIPALNGYGAKEYINIVRALVGDVVGYANKNDNYKDTYFYVVPDESQNITKLIDLFLGKSTDGKGTFNPIEVTLTDNDSTWTEVTWENMPKGAVAQVSGAINFDDTSDDVSKWSWTKKITKSFNDIIAKIENKENLTASDYGYLQNLPYNGYKIINYFATTSGKGGSITVEEYAMYVAIANVKYEMELILNLAAKSLSEYMNDTQKMSTLTKENKADYEKVLTKVAKQLELLKTNDDIKNMQTFEAKIRKLLSEDYTQNRKDKIGN